MYILLEDDISYLIYTSGSTGNPKGVMLRHKGICNYLTSHPANTHINFIKNNIDTYLSVTTVSFDMSFKEHTAALCNGKTLVFASEDEMNDPRALAELMKKNGVDVMKCTPLIYEQYAGRSAGEAVQFYIGQDNSFTAKMLCHPGFSAGILLVIPYIFSKKRILRFSLGGITLIKSIAYKMGYTRVLNMNNTVIEFALKAVNKGE